MSKNAIAATLLKELHLLSADTNKLIIPMTDAEVQDPDTVIKGIAFFRFHKNEIIRLSKNFLNLTEKCKNNGFISKKKYLFYKNKFKRIKQLLNLLIKRYPTCKKTDERCLRKWRIGSKLIIDYSKNLIRLIFISLNKYKNNSVKRILKLIYYKYKRFL